MTRYLLLQKLQRIEALKAGATTTGERGAASAASERVIERLKKTPPEPIPQGISQVPMGPDPILRGPEPPTRSMILARLHAWKRGDLRSLQVWKWAALVVDKTLLPDAPPDHPDSVAVEVVMELSSWRHAPWFEGDVDALIVFLESPIDASREAWGRWFGYQESRQRR